MAAAAEHPRQARQCSLCRVAAIVVPSIIGCSGGEGQMPPGDASDSTPSAWANWPMPNTRGLGLPNQRSYEIASGEVVRDEITGLSWQREIDSESRSASSAAEYCAALVVAGADDWRLPSRIELVSILDLSRTAPSIDLTAFPSAPPDWYWTSSASAADTSKAWFVYFYFGYPNTDDADGAFRVRCVRGGSAHEAVIPARYETTSDNVRDLGTGLVWQRTLLETAASLEQAERYCLDLELASASDWRLPSMQELETLVDERQSGPAIDSQAFPGTQAEPFWSSSRWSGTPTLAWYVEFAQGSALYDLTTTPYRVRCVR